MNHIRLALQRHANYVKRYPAAIALICACCAVILTTSYQNHTFYHAIGYIAASWFCCLLTDVVLYARPVAPKELPVKKPVRNELFTIIGCTLAGAAFLCVRFFSNWEHLPGLLKIALMPLLLFMFQIPTALIYLFRYKYKPSELGINLRYWYLPLILHIVWGGVTLWLAPEQSHWQEALKGYGIIGMLFTGFISAALPEEFLRMLLQTRIGKAANSIGLGMFIATAIWSALHIPIGHGQSHEPMTLWGTIQGTSYLVPLGIFWGYLTQRTQSLVPALGMHGLNLWGLQNF